MRCLSLVFVLVFGSGLAYAKTGPHTDLDKLFEGRQFAEFFKEATRRADKGDAHAQFLLGKAYQFGDGVVTDLNRARALYSLAAKQDHAHALNNLAIIIDGQDRKPRTALKLIERALSLGMGHPAATNASMLRERLCRRERDVSFCIAEAETHEALWDVGGAETSLEKALSAYQTGCDIARDDQSKMPEWAVPPEQRACALAIGLAERGAERGLPSATYARAVLAYGESNHDEAIRWFALAHDRGSADATYALGFMHMNGHGSNQSAEKALEWYHIAALRGSRKALDRLVDYWDEQSLKDYSRENIEKSLAELVKLRPEQDPSTWAGAERLKFMEAVSANAHADRPSPSAVVESRLCFESEYRGLSGDWQLFEIGRPEDIERLPDAMPKLAQGTDDGEDCIRFTADALRQIRAIFARGHTPTLRIGKHAYLLSLIPKSADTLRLEVAYRIWGRFTK